MSRNQVILLFLLSIVFGLGAVFFAKQWMDRQLQPQTELEVVEREPVIIASQEIPAGTPIEEQHITTKLLEVEWRNEGQFTDQNAILGQVVATTIFPGEVLHQNRLTVPGEGSTLASLIPENKRAVTIRVNDVIGVAGFLLPGNRVDVLNTIKYSATSANTVTVLKDIKVLAVDQTARTKENKPIIVRAVTLEVSPKDAEKLLTARSKGEIQLTLRNPHEEEKVVKKYVAPSVTILKGTESSNIRVRD
ncbi:Flp pilus assembly protein CpaB [Vibrio sp. MarTm2]|uniref:Pilus assembly protein CpaB n=2 Tax=Vibrio TaxID=662 RepID=A0A0A5HU51_PHOS4|nr:MULTISPECIES: Flp pilus assembly protein CpaB [Vibrio]KGY09072.1 pilus assembly protein CpaB [Vibrio sinaloensis]KHA60235.1 pilus assembly protein CpaB [Vibrio variabilis]KHT46211.1 pilus assembly protein CpaB [Vibrio sinaloensis]KHT49433.1 pilus assembly protein CpaB [Vibrio sinaloensis]KIE22183.1 pilus assembly protein CpaB [Vibrio sinaloensis]